MIRERELRLKRGDRVLLVCDGEAWFVRHVRSIVHDGDRDEMVYHCDEHLAGPLALEEARAVMKKLVQE